MKHAITEQPRGSWNISRSGGCVIDVDCETNKYLMEARDACYDKGRHYLHK